MVLTVLLMVAGVGFAALGGELFVRGVVNIAAWSRVPKGIIGATVAAFATSGPELSVGINAAVAGEPEIALGDALGSNVVNIAVVLGVALLFAELRVSRGTRIRELPMAITAPVALGLLALDGTLSRTDALLLLAIFAGWIVQTTLAARRARDATAAVLLEQSKTAIVASFVGGLVALIVAGRLIVASASDIGAALGWDGFIVGAVIVAIGTSTPEVATMLAARLRRHDEVGVGTVLGSNIFNTLLIVGVASLISPIDTDAAAVRIGIIASTMVVVLAIPGRGGRLARWRSIPLIGSYLAVLALLSA